jgi:hypothetical protein
VSKLSCFAGGYHAGRLIGLLLAMMCLVAIPLGSVRADPPLPALYRDTANYPPLQLTWSPDSDHPQVLGVFPHPFMTQRALLATAAGLLLSDDGGKTWTPLPEATADKIGPVQDVAFHPVQADTFYLASQTRGIWQTLDAGKSFTPIGTKAGGLAADNVASLVVYAGDASHQTLLAGHGDAAPGLSRSQDGGKTWDVVNADYHFRRLLTGPGALSQFYLFGSSLKEPDIQSLYTCNTVGEFVTEVLRDVVPTDMVFMPTPYRKPPAIYVTTSDSGLYRIDNGGTAGLSYNTKQIPFKDATGWASVGSTWGASADVLSLFLYDPAKLGLVISSDDLATYHTASDGLPVGSLVKEGAVLRPNANGTVFYAVTNNALTIGRAPEDVPVVQSLPPAFEVQNQDDKSWGDIGQAFQTFADAQGRTLTAARTLLQNVGDPTSVYHAHELIVTARVPITPAPPKAVTIDLSRYGGYPDTPMLDDGAHQDGAAGEGVYGVSFEFLPERARTQDNETRPVWPGPVPLGVKVTYADGHQPGAVDVVNVLTKVTDVGIWSDGVGAVTDTVEGGVTVEPFLNPLEKDQPAYAPHLHHGDVAVRMKAPKGKWAVHFKAPYNRLDISSHPALSLYLRLDAGSAPTQLFLQLKDEPAFSPPTTTAPVPLLAGVTLTPAYQRVTLPMTKILGQATLFQVDHLDEIILSGENDAPGTLVIDGLQVLSPATATALSTP